MAEATPKVEEPKAAEAPTVEEPKPADAPKAAEEGKAEPVNTVDDGEQGDDTVYKEEASLFRFDSSTKEWKQRGKGYVRFLRNRESGKVRIVLRQHKTLKIRMNHIVAPSIDLKPNLGSDRSWTWSTTDFADEPEGKLEVFAIRFVNSEIANKFKEMYDKVRQVNDGAKIELAKVEDIEKREEDEEDEKKADEAGAGAEAEAGTGADA